MKNFLLFGAKAKGKVESFALLLLRVVGGGLILTHGIEKIKNFSYLSTGFLDPIGLGPKLTLVGAIGAELFAAVFVIIGLLTRLALIPLIMLMAGAFFIVHANDPFATKELALIYMGLFIVLFLLGPGDYSLDRTLFKK